jgi:hypothetical protein
MFPVPNKYRIINYAPKSSYGQLSIFYSTLLKIPDNLPKIRKIVFIAAKNLRQPRLDMIHLLQLVANKSLTTLTSVTMPSAEKLP